MKRNCLFVVALLFVLLPLSAQKYYSVQGLYVISSITDGDKTAASLPFITYKSYIRDKAFSVQTDLNNSTGDVHLRWGVEVLPYQEEPFAAKLVKNPDGSIVHRWYNTFVDFMDFPQYTWIDETYTKVQDDRFIERVSDVFSHVDEKSDYLGTWKRVAARVITEDSDMLRPASCYRIVGKNNCLVFDGSLYNIEARQPAMLRDFHWSSPEEYTEAGVTYHIESISPSQYVVKTEYVNGSIVYETWIRYDVPEPLKFMMKNFNKSRCAELFNDCTD